jgi:hypothetical protein
VVKKAMQLQGTDRPAVVACAARFGVPKGEPECDGPAEISDIFPGQVAKI